MIIVAEDDGPGHGFRERGFRRCPIPTQDSAGCPRERSGSRKRAPRMAARGGELPTVTDRVPTRFWLAALVTVSFTLKVRVEAVANLWVGWGARRNPRRRNTTRSQGQAAGIREPARKRTPTGGRRRTGGWPKPWRRAPRKRRDAPHLARPAGRGNTGGRRPFRWNKALRPC